MLTGRKQVHEWWTKEIKLPLAVFWLKNVAFDTEAEFCGSPLRYSDYFRTSKYYGLSLPISLLFTTSPLVSDIIPLEHKKCINAAAVIATFHGYLPQIWSHYSKQLSPLIIESQDYRSSWKMRVTHLSSALLVARGVFCNASQTVVWPKANPSKSVPPCLHHPIYNLPHYLASFLCSCWALSSSQDARCLYLNQIATLQIITPLH